MTDTKETLLNKMYKTQAARFNADNRLRWEYKLAHYSMMMLSVYVVALTLSEKFFAQPLILHSDFISICLSVLLIGVASFEAGNDRLQEAYLLHENALKINALYNESQAKEDVVQIAKEYAEIKSQCKYNHSSYDYYWHVANNLNVPWWPQRILAIIHSIIGFCIHYGIYIAIILSPIILWLIPTLS